MQRNLQSEFDEILKNLIFPFFKEMGFKKNGNGFNKKVEELIQVVNIQKSRWNSVDSLTFTFNIGFFNSEVHFENSSNQIPKFLKEYDCQFRFRLGQLIKGNDYWYELNKSVNQVNLEIEIYKDLNNFLKPILEEIKDLNSLNEILINNKNLDFITSPLYKINMYLKIGEIEKAKIILNEEYLSAMNPEDYVSKIIYPDGTEEIQTSKSKINFDYVKTLKEIAENNNIILN